MKETRPGCRGCCRTKSWRLQEMSDEVINVAEAEILAWAKDQVERENYTVRSLSEAIGEKNNATLSRLLSGKADEDPTQVSDVARGRIVHGIRRLMERLGLLMEDPDYLEDAARLILRWPVRKAERESDPIEFFRSLYEEEGWSLRAIGREVGYEGSVVSKVLSGKYNGDMVAIGEAFTEGRRRVLGPSMGAIIKTAASDALEQALQESLGSEYLTVVYGEPGTGKTDTIRRFHMRGQGKSGGHKTILLTTSYLIYSTTLLRQLASALGVEPKGSADVLLSRVEEKLIEDRHLLIFDEVNNLASRPKAAVGVLNLIRHLVDATACGAVLVGTKNLFDMITDHRYRYDLNMIASRIDQVVELPTASLKEVRALLISHFGDLSEQVWTTFLAGLRAESRTGRLSLRRVAVFVKQARRIQSVNGADGKPLTPRFVKMAWANTKRTD
ncbi:MAG TPA: ATP-binding protein [Rhizobium sp.]|nr:ATP-binding protein [Rhizobium sp.]